MRGERLGTNAAEKLNIGAVGFRPRSKHLRLKFGGTIRTESPKSGDVTWRKAGRLALGAARGRLVKQNDCNM